MHARSIYCLHRAATCSRVTPTYKVTKSCRKQAGAPVSSWRTHADQKATTSRYCMTIASRGRRPDAGRPRRAHRAGRVRRMKASPYTIDNDFATTHAKQRGPILHHDASAAKHACMHVYVCLHMRAHMMKLICRAACIHVYLYICIVYACA
jgi:hypothetical protein